MLILYLTFGVRLFSSAAALFSFPPAVDEIYNSSTSLLALVIFQFFNVLLSGRKVVSLWFSFAFPRWLRMFSFFSCAYWSSRETFFGQVFVPLFCPFLFLISCFFLLLSFDSSIYILDPSPLSGMWFAKILLPVSGLSFNFLNSVFWRAKKSNLSVFSVACGFGVVANTFLSNSRSQKFSLTFSSKSYIVLDLMFRSILS